MNLNQATIPCQDDAVSVRFYVTRGLRPVLDGPPDYARFETDAGTKLPVHRAVPDGARGNAVAVCFEADDVDATVAALQADGTVLHAERTEGRCLCRAARLTGPAGNGLYIFHAGRHRLRPRSRVQGDDTA